MTFGDRKVLLTLSFAMLFTMQQFLVMMYIHVPIYIYPYMYIHTYIDAVSLISVILY